MGLDYHRVPSARKLVDFGSYINPSAVVDTTRHSEQKP